MHIRSWIDYFRLIFVTVQTILTWMSLEPTSIAYPSSYLGDALLFLTLTCFLKTLSYSWCNRPLRACLYLFLGSQTTAWPVMHTGLTGYTWVVWFSSKIWTTMNCVTFFLASKACDSPQLSSFPSWESCLALNLGGAHEGIMTHIRALKTLDIF
jgi:hypothetical protein